MDGWKMSFLLGFPIFRGYVELRGGTSCDMRFVITIWWPRKLRATLKGIGCFRRWYYSSYQPHRSMVKWLPFSSKTQIQKGISAFFSVKSCSYLVLLIAQMKVHLRLRVASFDINPRYFPTHTWEINVSTDSVFSDVISTHNSSVTGTHQLKSHELARCTLSADILPLFASLKTWFF